MSRDPNLKEILHLKRTIKDLESKNNKLTMEIEKVQQNIDHYFVESDEEKLQFIRYVLEHYPKNKQNSILLRYSRNPKLARELYCE